MGMNIVHGAFCRSNAWRWYTAKRVVPQTLEGLDLGEHTLEIGPGYGANLRALGQRTGRLTAVELDQGLVDRLRQRFGETAEVVQGDGARLPFADNAFSSVVCFTMLHHVPTATEQDALFAEALRVLRPGGVLAGSDGVDSLPFRLAHLNDTYNPVTADRLPQRLAAAGFRREAVVTKLGELRFRAFKA